MMQPIPFLDQIFRHLEIDGIDLSLFELDHICFRVETAEAYEKYKTLLGEKGQMLAETLVNGRPIANFKLQEPILYEGREIWVLELPFPKSGSPYSEGFEHVEFVTKGSLEELMNLYPELDFDQKGMNKSINREVRLKYGNLSVKFHEQSLEEVIGWENSYKG